MVSGSGGAQGHPVHWPRKAPCIVFIDEIDPWDLIWSRDYMGGCQNYGPFLDPYYNTAPNI